MSKLFGLPQSAPEHGSDENHDVTARFLQEQVRGSERAIEAILYQYPDIANEATPDNIAQATNAQAAPYPSEVAPLQAAMPTEEQSVRELMTDAYAKLRQIDNEQQGQDYEPAA